jgi:anti-sigma factor ChrR (cupin superfamily)
MKTNYKLAVAMLVGITLGAVPQGYAQGPGAHSTVTPDQLQWKDVPALGPGMKLALIEGPMNEAVPFIVRIKFPAGARVPAHWHPAIEHVTVNVRNFRDWDRGQTR